MVIVAARHRTPVENRKDVCLPYNSLLIASVRVLRILLLAHVPMTAMTAIAAENVAVVNTTAVYAASSRE